MCRNVPNSHTLLVDGDIGFATRDPLQIQKNPLETQIPASRGWRRVAIWDLKKSGNTNGLQTFRYSQFDT